MNPKTAWQHFSELPIESQQQVIDFIAFLQTRSSPVRPRKTIKAPKLTTEAFIGIWQDRKDLQGSTRWVRNLREQEWSKP